MANHKSAIKRARQNELRRLRNKAVKTRIKSIVKEVRSSTGDYGKTQLQAAQSVIDRASKKGVIHKRTAARKISRLTKLANSTNA